MATAPGYADVSCELTLTGFTRPSYITFGVDTSLTDPVLLAADILNAWRFAGSMKSIMDNSTTLTLIRVGLGTDGGEDLVFSQPAAEVGGGGTLQSLPPNCAVLFHKRTARGGRRGRGRFFLPWSINETDVSETGILTTIAQTAQNAAATVFRNQLAAAGHPMVILHGPGKTAGGVPDVVTSITCDPLISTQRRRLGR